MYLQVGLTVALLIAIQLLASPSRSSSPATLGEALVLDERQSNWNPSAEDNWNYWWSYSGFSGPDHWGVLNLDWFLCDKGRKQSPIDIRTNSLVYDPHLSPLKIDTNLISGLLYNDGHAIVFDATRDRLAQNESTLNQIAAADNSVDSDSNQNQTNGRATRGQQPSRRSPRSDSLFEALASAAATGDDDVDGKSMMNSGLLQDMRDSVKLSIAQTQEGQRFGQSPDAESSDDILAMAADSLAPQHKAKVQISGAGLAYSYKFELFYLRFGDSESKFQGSEHRINSRSFAGELQLFAYNSDLYKSFAEASSKPNGLLAIAVLIESRESLMSAPKTQDVQGNTSQSHNNNSPSGQLEGLLQNSLRQLGHRGAAVPVEALNLSALLPELSNFVAYEGSLTTPGCHESVAWIVLNRPLYLSSQKLQELRLISADEQANKGATGTLIAGNVRPVQPVNGRPIRTSIRPSAGSDTQRPEQTCQRLWTRYEYKEATS